MARSYVCGRKGKSRKRYRVQIGKIGCPLASVGDYAEKKDAKSKN